VKIDNKILTLVLIVLIVHVTAFLLLGYYYFFPKLINNTSTSIEERNDKNFFVSNKDNKLEIFYEKIPGSKFHSPDATWWGYNQNKIARFGNLVLMYVIENFDDSNKTLSNFVIYKKEGNTAWEKGAYFPTSRPGNILIDSSGTLHAFVFEPTDVVKNDSIGKLVHYWFPNSKSGDITNYKQEVVVEAIDNVETVNIRVGSAIAPDDTMTVGFGLTTYNPLYKGHSEHIYFKKPSETQWNHLIAGENLGHDFYYPFVLATEKGFHLLSVQDDFTGAGNPNIYQKIIYFEYQSGTWKQEIIADLSTHTLAKTRPRLLEQEELFQDKEGTIHVIYKEFLDPKETWKSSSHKHVFFKNGDVETKIIDVSKNSNWIRLFEAEGTLYYLVTAWDSLHIGRVGSNKLENIKAVPSDAKGIYPYVATARSGTRESEKYIDILLLAADQSSYKDATNANYYIRIPKTELSKIE